MPARQARVALERVGCAVQPQERELLIQLNRYPNVVAESAQQYDPSHLANYLFNLAKTFNKFYADLSILNSDDEQVRSFRVKMSELTADVIEKGMKLLGIQVPERM